MKRILFIAAIALLAASMSFGMTVVPATDTTPQLDITGYQWDRYAATYTDRSETGSGFSIQRTYITTQVKGTDYEGRLTLDINNNQYGEIVNATALPAQGSVDWAIWVKYGYADLTNLPCFKMADIKLRIGLQPVYFGEIDTWQYPTIEKTVEDILSLVSSGDQGMAVLGNLPMGYGDYQIEVTNGAGYKKVESNLGKQITGSINIIPISGIGIRYSYLSNNTGEDGLNAMGQPSALFAANEVQALELNYATGPIEGYLEGVQSESKDSAATSGILQAVSAYLGVKVIDQAQVVLRYDETNPDTKGSKNLQSAYAPYNRYIAGVNYFLTKNCTLQFDYEMVQEKIKGSKVNAISAGPLSPIGAINSNANQLLAQLVWGW